MLGHAGKFCKALTFLSSGYLPISAQGLPAYGKACLPMAWFTRLWRGLPAFSVVGHFR